MLTIPAEYYGDNSRWFMATVVDNVPPYGMEGKVKVSIKGIHSTDTNDIPHKDLPWADVVIPSTHAGASGKGMSPRLTPGTQVYGVFLDGVLSQLPLIIGQIHTTEYPNDNQEKNILIPDAPPDAASRLSVALKYFLDLGYKPHICASIVGTMDYVSRLNPLYEENNYFGLMGWEKTKNRFQALQNFSNTFDPRYGYRTFVAQLAFTAFELRTSKSEVIGKLIRTNTISSNKSVRRISGRVIVGSGSAQLFASGYLENSYLRTANYESIESKSIQALDYFS